jgi:hypothetical protein
MEAVDLMNMLITSQYLHNNGGGGGGSSGGENKFLQLANKTITTITEKDLEGATQLVNEAFSGQRALTSLSIPDSVTILGTYLCNWCESLEYVKLPKGLTSISNYMFQFCSKLKSITLPDSVRTIGQQAFYAGRLESMNIPSSLVTIGKSAFQSCRFPSIDIPDHVTTIGEGAFCRNSAAKTITVGNGVQVLDGVFKECWCESAVFGNNVTSMKSTFQHVETLKSFTIKTETPPTIDIHTFWQVPADCAIYVPANSVDAYKTATNWSDRADYIFAIEE